MIYRFDQCELDDVRHEFRRNGTVEHIEPQVFDLLLVLLQRPGDLISRDALVDAVWHGRIVSEATIAARISAARKAVGDTGKDQRIIVTVPRRGIRLACAVETSGGMARSETEPETEASQHVRFARSGDGTALAYATTGKGPPLLRGGHWLTHLELDWHNPVWRPLLSELGQDFSVTRWDQRGTGLSPRDAQDFDLERMTDDMEAVADAAGLTRFGIFAVSQSVPAAVNFAVRHPDRVSGMVLYGGFVAGLAVRGTADQIARNEAFQTLVRDGWGNPESAMVQAFSTMFMPDATGDQLLSFVRMQLESASAETVISLRRAIAHYDIETLLPKVAVPTLVVHAQHDTVQPARQGQRLAAGIPGAELLMLDSRNHVPLPQDPAFNMLVSAVKAFLTRD